MNHYNIYYVLLREQNMTTTDIYIISSYNYDIESKEGDCKKQ